MKDPKALFPFLFASSWLGNLLLTLLAFYLAFSHEGPLAPLTLLTVAVCILSGNLLPILAYALFTRWRRSELEAESVEVSLRVREALVRSEEVMGRLDEAEGALAKGILIARQVPERIAERFAALEELAGRLDTLELDAFTGTLQGQGASLESLQRDVAQIQAALRDLQVVVDGLPKGISKAVTAALPEPPAPAPASETDVPLEERLDLLFESLESVQDTLDGLLARVAAGPDPATAAAAPFAPVGETVGAHAAPETPPTVSTEPDPEAVRPGEPVEEEVIIIEEPDELIEVIEEAFEEDDPVPAEPLGRQDEMDLGPSARLFRSTPGGVRGRVEISVQAMVGISNKLYIRGDEPWLSWDQGEPMDLVGIGEFAWHMDDLKESIEVSILLNDESETEGSRLTLKPGKPVRLHLQFPRNEHHW